VVQQPILVRNIPKIVHLGDAGDPSHSAILVASVVGKLCSTTEAMVSEHLKETSRGHETSRPSVSGHGPGTGFG
jgi:hypothetical protein